MAGGGGGHLDPHRFPIESMMAVILVMPFVASTLVTLGELSLDVWSMYAFCGLKQLFRCCIIHNDPSKNHVHQLHHGLYPVELVPRYLLEEEMKDSTTLDP